MQHLSNIHFKNEFTTHFDGDDTGNLQPRQTPGKLYSKAIPTPVQKVGLLAWSNELAAELELVNPLDETADKDNAQADIEILGGNLVTPSMHPYAACYAGHQFGNWAGQLGDGRAITLGELQTSNEKSWELQLKGPGKTPYSRSADGRAVLRSSVREYLMSEAMHYLGVPTTRALSLVTTGDKVMRDMFYNGNPEFEPGAIVMRVAPTFIRFGNFEVLAARREMENLTKLVDWTIEKYYPLLTGADNIINWFKEVVAYTIAMIVEWLRVGFVHGVMNTDNMSILGLTIDYGPFSFLDDFDLNFTPNTTDLPGRRYAFGRQASVAKWNLSCLASAIAPLADEEKLIEALNSYDDLYWAAYYNMMVNKMGLDEVRETDPSLIVSLENMLAKVKPDMTIFYQLLITVHQKEDNDYVRHFAESFYHELSDEEIHLFNSLMKDYVARIETNTISKKAWMDKMKQHNPRFILRNYLLHNAIQELEQGNNELFIKLQQALKEPYSNKYDAFFVKRPTWATQKAGCSMLSCSS